MSYSRHALNEADIDTPHDVNYKVHMQVRRMVSESRNLRRRKATLENAASVRDLQLVYHFDIYQVIVYYCPG